MDSLAADDLEYNYDMAGLAALRRRLAAAIHDFKGASVQYEAVIRQVRPHLLDFGGKPCLGLGVEVQVGTHSNCCSTAPSCNYVSGCVCVCSLFSMLLTQPTQVTVSCCLLRRHGPDWSHACTVSNTCCSTAPRHTHTHSVLFVVLFVINTDTHASTYACAGFGCRGGHQVSAVGGV